MKGFKIVLPLVLAAMLGFGCATTVDRPSTGTSPEGMMDSQPPIEAIIPPPPPAGVP